MTNMENTTLHFDMQSFLKKHKKKSPSREITDEMLNIFRKTLKGEIYLTREKEILGTLKNPKYKKHFYKVVNDEEFVEEKIEPTWYNVFLHKLLFSLTMGFLYIFNNKRWKEKKTIISIQKNMVNVIKLADQYQNSKSYGERIDRMSELNLIHEDGLKELVDRDKE